MLHSSKLGLELWAEATACAVYLLNRVLCSAMETMTPYEGWHGRKSNLTHLRIFRSTAHMHVPKDERSKLDSKSLKCRFIGYSETQKAFRLFDPSSNKVKISRDVIFREESGPPQDAECGAMNTISDLLSDTDWEDADDERLKPIAEHNTDVVTNDKNHGWR